MNEAAKELAALLSAECKNMSDVQAMLKSLFKSTIETMLEAVRIQYDVCAVRPAVCF